MEWVDTNKENRLNEGDIAYFPELLSRAGEFKVWHKHLSAIYHLTSIKQGMYFIGRQITWIFPRDIVNMVETNNIGLALRSRYEEMADLLLKEQRHGITLNDFKVRIDADWLLSMIGEYRWMIYDLNLI